MNNSSDKIIETIGLTFDDVLLLPNYTEVKRGETDFSSYLTAKTKLEIPLICAPMDTVTDNFCIFVHFCL